MLLLVLMPLLLIARAWLSTLTRRLHFTSAALDGEHAFHAAEAGIHDAVDRANTATLVQGAPIAGTRGRGMAYCNEGIESLGPLLTRHAVPGWLETGRNGKAAPTTRP